MSVTCLPPEPNKKCETDTVPLITRSTTEHVKEKCPFADMLSSAHAWLALQEETRLETPVGDISNDSPQNVFGTRNGVEPGTPEYGLFLTNKAPTSSKKLWIDSHQDRAKSSSMVRNIKDFFRLPPSLAGNFLSNMNIPGQTSSCPAMPRCRNVSRFRSIDGACNNNIFTDWGLTNTALRRLIAASYSDGVSEPRVSVVEGRALPNARVLSTILYPEKDVPDEVNTLAVMQFGQLISHDTALSPDQQSLMTNSTLKCCGENGEVITSSDANEACISIDVPVNDSFYSQFNVRCLNVVRSMTTLNKKCRLGPAEQFSAVTHFLDASFVYGSEQLLADSLRLRQGGLLKTQKTKDGRHFMPNSKEPTKDCDVDSDDSVCYEAGDGRVNQHPGVAIIHTLFLREHNRIAGILQDLNSHWDDDRLYLEAKRIVIAIWQHITYIEWLPLVLGNDYVKKRNMSSVEGFSEGYDDHLDPSTLNSFTAGAFRSFHSMAQGFIKFVDQDQKSRPGFPLREWFDRTTILQEDDKFDLMTRGMTSQPSQAMDEFVSEDLTNFLFKHKNSFGLDLESLDIQRGRDHGLAPYNDFRELCGLPRANNFSDLTDHIDEQRVELLSQHYLHVDDVDLFVGGRLERLIPGTLAGITFQCIMGEQFFRWKFGDRWFYDFKENPASFTLGGVKMVCASFVAAVVVWITVQFGAHLNLLNVNVLALKAPHGLQSFFGDHAALSGGSNRLPRSIRAIPSQLLDVEEEVLQDSVNFGEGVVSRLGRLEVNLASSDVKVSSGSPVHGQLIDSYPDLKALEQGKHALVAVKASLFLAQNTCQRYGLDDDQCGQFVTSMKLNSTQLGSKCTPQDGPSFSCVLSTKYRSLDGSCNNPSHYSWGKAFTGYRRLIFPHYGDGVQEPRKPVQGRALPSARKVSTSMTQNGSTAHSESTLAAMQWGQFVEHDLVHTPVSKMISTGNSIICCRQDGSHLSPRYLHPSCFPITIPGNDPVYSKFGLQCMNYVRTVNAMRSDCSFGPAEQMNQATHFLDGSMIYGSTLEQHQKLRSFTNGKMLESRNGKTYLPLTDKPMHYCQLSSNSATCYKSGDIRVNAHPQLTVMHTVWLREHNRVAGELAALNPHWIDSKLFEEARRIVVAEIQHITYSEWLPLVLGDKYTKKMGLKLKKNGFSEDYDENVNPTVTNGFATAAIRFLYSMMEGNIKLFDEHRNHNGSIALNHNYNKPRVVEESGKIDELLRGLATQNGQKSDLEYSSDVLSLLYRDMDRYGMDVVSLDIQRGRDHGLPGYNHFRKLCGLTKVKNFNGFQDVISKAMVQKMQSVYSHPDDVDLMIGGMAERPIDGSLLGPTFRCIVAEQFAKTKRGDKFFYDLSRKSGSFTDGQLREIRKTTLGRIFCDNGDNIHEMQSNVFQTPSTSNPLSSCQNTTVLPRLSFTSWKELPTRSL